MIRTVLNGAGYTRTSPDTRINLYSGNKNNQTIMVNNNSKAKMNISGFVLAPRSITPKKNNDPVTDPMAKLKMYMSLMMMIGISPAAMKQLSKLLAMLTDALSPDSSVTEAQVQAEISEYNKLCSESEKEKKKNDKVSEKDHEHNAEWLADSDLLARQLSSASAGSLLSRSLPPDMAGCLTDK
ncbi:MULTISPECIES: hypothetical protein [Enterobacteriaceae]|nr:hypothetical protein [Enterobacter hormaechei]